MSDAPDDWSGEVVPGGRPGAFLVRLDGRDQSLVDLADPTRLDFDYVRRTGDVLDAVAPAGEPVRVVHVGGAGLTLPRYVTHTRPRSAQVVLEPDERLTALVREQLPLARRSGIKVRPQEGREGLAALRDDHVDVVVIDAYAGGEVPPSLLTTGCVEELDRVLAPGGLVVLNLADRAPFALARDVVAALRTRFAAVAVSAEPATLRGRRPGNLLVVAGAAGVPTSALRHSARTSAAPYRVLAEGEVGSSLGGGTPLRDPVLPGG
ncbi:MAG: spermidine synthase [Marmoricola sp.]|nr:spermidine synthase [Marmoricola sp.]